MNTSVISKFAKSKYVKQKDGFYLVLDAFVFAVELGIVFCGFFLINRAAGNSEALMNLTLYLILGVAYFYVLFEIIYIKRRQKKLNLEQAQIHHNYVRRSVLGLVTVTAIIAVIAILAAAGGKIYSNENAYGLCIWCMAVFGLEWTDGYYIKSAVLFGENCFYSGKYKINYSSITEVRELSKHTAGIGFYDIYFVELYDGEKLIGMDKLFSDEYFFLLKKINGR